jgi:hypothetical protein
MTRPGKRPTAVYPMWNDRMPAALREANQACQREHRATWAVLQRKGNRSAFSGYRWTPSDYSAVRCGECGRVWRTNAAYVDKLPDDIDLHPSRYFSSHPDCSCPGGVKGADPKCGMHGAPDSL